MLSNHFRVALRHLRRHPYYTGLNVTGLAVGMACVVLIALYIRHELSYDRFHDNADRIVRMAVDIVVEGEARQNVMTPGVLAPALAADLPEVERAVRLMRARPVFRVGEVQAQEPDIAYADPAVFEVFDGFRLLRGDPATVLDAPGSLVLSEALASKYFGTTDPIGQAVQSGDETLTVTGVMANAPSNSHLTATGVVALSTFEDPGWWYTNWHSVNFATYMLLREGTRVEAFRDKLPAFIEARAGDEVAAMNQPIVLHAERLPDLHLHSAYARTGSVANLFIFGAIAGFVLLIAGLNVVNLSTARSTERAKEVGVRKTLGARRAGIAGQFLTEAVLLSLAALALAVVIVQAALPFFARLAGIPLVLGDLGLGLLGLAGLVLATGLLAGAYPAVALSRFRPHAVLKGRFVARGEGAWLRRGLVVVQLSLTIALMAGTAVVYSQLDYMQNRNLGFDPGSPETGQLLTLDFGGESAVQERLGAIKQRLLQHPRVTGVTSSLTVPTGGHPSAGGAVEAPNGQWRDFSVEAYLVDTAFVDVYAMTLVAGTRPGAATTSDSLVAYVFNETAVRAAGYGSPSDILGKQAGFWGTPGEVVGVVQDFHVQGLQHPVRPLALAALPTYHNYLTLRVRTEQLQGTLADLRQIWSEMAPQRPFVVRFLDDAFGAQYAAERRFGTLFGVFAGLAILIACLGLVGLVAFAAQQRTKEIGVRKVLGATTASIVALLTKEVMQLAGVAFIVAAPVIYWAMEQWLSGFAYRTEVGWGVVLASGLVALVVAAGTAGARAWQAARIDPARALRSE